MGYPELERSIETLTRHRRDYRIHAKYLVPDLVLLGYVQEALEHGLAVVALAASAVPHRAAPNARAIFEAAQYALLLMTHHDVPYAGALAWVYQLRKDHKLQDELEALGYSSDTDEERGLELAITEMEQRWGAYSPGSGELLRRAQQELDQRRGSVDNWLGQNAGLALDRQLCGYNERSGKGLPLLKRGTFKALYATLFRETHPQLSLRPRELRGRVGGEITVAPELRALDATAKMAVGIAKSAIDYVCLAVAMRSHLDPAA